MEVIEICLDLVSNDGWAVLETLDWLIDSLIDLKNERVYFSVSRTAFLTTYIVVLV